ncbi:hypothetical protein CEK25_004159 [Fusarium fujikuroi]|nr:hypothetical protein CEK25_004159 [Fusarium fujikuroi]
MNFIDTFFGLPLLMGSLTLSSFSRVITLTLRRSTCMSRYSVYVLEAYDYVYTDYPFLPSTFNLLAHFFRPFYFTADEKFRAGRIFLKATHWPIVGIIKLYEMYRKPIKMNRVQGSIEDESSRRNGPSRNSRSNLSHVGRQTLSESNRGRQTNGPRGASNGRMMWMRQHAMEVPPAMEDQLTEL